MAADLANILGMAAELRNQGRDLIARADALEAAVLGFGGSLLEVELIPNAEAARMTGRSKAAMRLFAKRHGIGVNRGGRLFILAHGLMRVVRG